jgi:hypothetical protein
MCVAPPVAGIMPATPAMMHGWGRKACFGGGGHTAAGPWLIGPNRCQINPRGGAMWLTSRVADVIKA